jgi:serine protease Do
MAGVLECLLDNESEPFSVHATEEDAVSAGDLLRQCHRLVKVASKIGTKNCMSV